MPLKISAAEVKNALTEVNRWRAKAQGIAKSGEKTTERIVRTVEVSAAGFAIGVVKGKWGADAKVWGVPVDLIAGVGLHALGYLGIAGKAQEHLHAFGDGALAIWFSGLGAGVGANWAGGPKLAAYQGAKQAGLYGAEVAPPSDAEIARAAAAIQGA
jgi:hypothetical protein